MSNVYTVCMLLCLLLRCLLYMFFAICLSKKKIWISHQYTCFYQELFALLWDELNLASLLYEPTASEFSYICSIDPYFCLNNWLQKLQLQGQLVVCCEKWVILLKGITQVSRVSFKLLLYINWRIILNFWNPKTQLYMVI